MELVRCDLCGKEIDKRRGNKVKIEHNPFYMLFSRAEFEMDLCNGCTKELENKVREKRKKADAEQEESEHE